MNPCPVCRKDHDGPNGHFCAPCMGLSETQRLHREIASKLEGVPETQPPRPAKPQPKVRRSGFGARVFREDGHGCVERIHPTELLMESGDRGDEGL